MIIRAVVNNYDYLVKNERITKHELRSIYANPDHQGVWQNPDELLDILAKEHHVECIILDETAFKPTDFMPFLLNLRKKTNDKIMIIPVITNKKLITECVHRQFNQFFELDFEKTEEEQSFFLDGLLTNPRTASDVETIIEAMSPDPEQVVKNEKQVKAEVATKTKIIEQVRVEKELVHQQRIAFCNIFPNSGATTIALETFDFLTKQKIKTLLISFDIKLSERYDIEEKNILIRTEPMNFLDELALLESDNAVIIYDFSTYEFEALSDYEKFFSKMYHIFDYNYPKIWENPMAIQDLLQTKGEFILNRHETLPKIDKLFKESLAIPIDKNVYTFPNINRDEIVFAELNHTTSQNQDIHEALATLLNIEYQSMKRKPNSVSRFFSKFKK
ncbi:MAG: hypothetical protein ACRDCC_08635 [Culicoidibacterales bacterium]